MNLSPQKHKLDRHKEKPTHFCWWVAAILCSVITVAVIIAGIIVFVGYMAIHPRVPILSVVDAHLDQFQYDLAGVLVTQVTIVLRSENDNTKAHASFYDLKLYLIFDGTTIAKLMADPYDVRKNDKLDFNFVVTSSPIPLDPSQMQNVDVSINEDRVRFDLKGSARARWRVGILGSVKFWCHLDCQLYFKISDKTYIPSKCTSRAK